MFNDTSAHQASEVLSRHKVYSKLLIHDVHLPKRHSESHKFNTLQQSFHNRSRQKASYTQLGNLQAVNFFPQPENHAYYKHNHHNDNKEDCALANSYRLLCFRQIRSPQLMQPLRNIRRATTRRPQTAKQPFWARDCREQSSRGSTDKTMITSSGTPVAQDRIYERHHGLEKRKATTKQTTAPGEVSVLPRHHSRRILISRRTRY